MQIGPYVDDMPAAYMLADVVVALGGPREGFSRAMIEAQAMGRPWWPRTAAGLPKPCATASPAGSHRLATLRR